MEEDIQSTYIHTYRHTYRQTDIPERKDKKELTRITRQGTAWITNQAGYEITIVQRGRPTDFVKMNQYATTQDSLCSEVEEEEEGEEMVD